MGSIDWCGRSKRADGLVLPDPGRRRRYPPSGWPNISPPKRVPAVTGLPMDTPHDEIQNREQEPFDK